MSESKHTLEVYDAVATEIVARYRVEKRQGGGFWPYCVKAGSGTMELFIGHKTKCDEVAQALRTACLDGVFMASSRASDLAAEVERLRADFTALQHALVGDTGASAILTAANLRADLDAERRKVEALEKDAERWQPIETADSNALALLYAPPEALFVEPAKHLGEFRVAAPRNWTWATHWMPLPAPPAIDAALSEKGRT